MSEGLQKSLDAIDKHANDWRLTENIKKSNITTIILAILAYVDLVYTSQSYEISISMTTRRANLSVFLVLILMLMSPQFSPGVFTCLHVLVLMLMFMLMR